MLPPAINHAIFAIIITAKHPKQIEPSSSADAFKQYFSSVTVQEDIV
jgi:hypothetical protein